MKQGDKVKHPFGTGVIVDMNPLGEKSSQFRLVKGDQPIPKMYDWFASKHENRTLFTEDQLEVIAA